jgi:threonine/homoserine/homoserine lactone efflux protein
MGFNNFTLRIVFWALIVSGVAMTFIDAGMSTEWIGLKTNAGKISSELPFILALVVASINSGVGSIVTNPSSWYYVLTGGRQIASISDPTERMMCIVGICLLSVFLIIGIGGTLIIDLISNYYKTKDWSLAIAIAFGADVCFLIANYVQMAVKSVKK